MLDDKSMENAFRMGAADYITKPIKKLELVSRVKTIFAFYQYQEEIKTLHKDLKFSNLISKISIDAQTNPIIFHDDTKIIDSNKALLHLLNYSSLDEFLDNEKSISDFIYDSNCQVSEMSSLDWIESIHNEGIKSSDVSRVSIRTNDGLKHFIVNVSKLKDAAHLQYIIFFEEIDKPQYKF